MLHLILIGMSWKDWFISILELSNGAFGKDTALKSSAFLKYMLKTTNDTNVMVASVHFHSTLRKAEDLD